MTARKHDHCSFTKEEKRRGADTFSWFEIIRLDKGRRQMVVVGEAGSPNSSKIQMLCNTLEGKGFLSDMWVRKGGGENAQMMLFWSYLVRMAISSLIFLNHQMSCFHACCLDAIKGTTLRWEWGSHAHLLTCCYCCWVFFQKLCDLERRCTVWMMHRLQRALSVISLFIPPGRKKWVQANDSLLHGRGMQRSSGRNNKHSEGSIFVCKWGIKGEAIFPFPRSFQNSVCF